MHSAVALITSIPITTKWGCQCEQQQKMGTAGGRPALHCCCSRLHGNALNCTALQYLPLQYLPLTTFCNCDFSKAIYTASSRAFSFTLHHFSFFVIDFQFAQSSLSRFIH